MMKSWKLFLSLTLMLFSLMGCGDLLYLSKLGWHQSSISFHSVPVQEVLDKKELGHEAKDRIHFIQEVKRYGEEKLGLRKTNSYSSYFEVKGPVLHVITASEKDRLRLYRWDFPITGKVTYKGFFTREDILNEKRSLEARGYDTFVQQASAYSTLGWLKDPIFSSMLQQDESTLANLILHEMTHATIYFKGQTDLNEQIATFVGNQGAIDFLTEKYGKGAKEVAEAIDSQEDDLVFSRWIDQACQKASDFYAKEASRDEKLRGREGLFHRLKEDFKGMMVSFKTESYKNFEKVDINNAVLLAYRRYIHRLESFQILYEQSGRDTRKVVDYFKAIRVSGGKVVGRFAIENPEPTNRESE
jgi:predicted aminopeptidase